MQGPEEPCERHPTALRRPRPPRRPAGRTQGGPRTAPPSRPPAARPRRREGQRREGQAGAARRARSSSATCRAGRRRGTSRKKTLKWGAIVGFSGLDLAAITVYVIYRMIDIPNPNTDFEAQTTTVYYSDGEHVLGTFALQNRESIPLSEMPQSIQDAVISAEDRTFYTNNGIDIKGIVRAAWNNLHSGSIEQGASTITQQYVKILYLSQERTWTRKIKEAFLAVKLQNEQSKDQILEGYLNTIYFGRGAYGVQAAAQAYFDKDAKDLTVPESAVLASVLNSPTALDPANGKDARKALLARYDTCSRAWCRWATSTRRRPRSTRRSCRPFPEIRDVNTYGGQKGYLMTLVKNQLHRPRLQRQRDRGRRPQGHDDHRLQDGARRQQDREARCAAGAPPGPPHRTRVGRAGDRRPARHDRRPRLPAEPAQNWATSAANRGRRSRRSHSRPASRTASPCSDTFDGNSPYTYPDGKTVRNEGESPRHPDRRLVRVGDHADLGDRGFRQHRLRRPDVVRWATTVRKRSSTRRSRRNPQELAGARAEPRRRARAAPRSRPSTWPTATRRSPPTASTPTGTSSTRSPTPTASYEHKVKTTRLSPRSWRATSRTRSSRSSRSAPGRTRRRSSGRRPARPARDGVREGRTTSTCRRRGSSATRRSSRPRSCSCAADGNESLEGYLDPFFGAHYPTETWTAYMTSALQGKPALDFPDPAELHGESPTYSRRRRRARHRRPRRRRPRLRRRRRRRPRRRSRRPRRPSRRPRRRSRRPDDADDAVGCRPCQCATTRRQSAAGWRRRQGRRGPAPGGGPAAGGGSRRPDVVVAAP